VPTNLQNYEFQFVRIEFTVAVAKKVFKLTWNIGEPLKYCGH